MRVEVQNLKEMSAALAERWRAVQALTPEFMTPLVGPDFASLVARHRDDAKVAIGYDEDLAIAFFAFHPTSNGYARAIGAPFCDYQAIVSDPNVKLSGSQFLEMAGIASISSTSLMDPHGLFDQTTLSKVDAYRIDCSNGSSAYMEALRSANPKWAKNLRRLGNKMDRELGPIKLIGHDTCQASFDALMAIKVAQYHETGMTDVLRPQWVKGMMQELFDMRGADFGGCLVSLYSGDKFVAGQFGVRLGDWFHPWIASTCPLSQSYSPGIVFLAEMLREADTLGLCIIDLSEGHSHYKAQFCRAPYEAFCGIIGSQPATAPRQGSGALATISRRLDLIGAVEPDLGGRVKAIGAALAAAPRRLSARRNSPSRT